jgi:hypothetical protein
VPELANLVCPTLAEAIQQAGTGVALRLPWSGESPSREGPAMTSIRRINWAVLGANVGSTVLFTLLLLSPFLWGAHLAQWLLGLAIGIALGIYFYVRRERYTEPGPDADETRFPR